MALIDITAAKTSPQPAEEDLTTTVQRELKALLGDHWFWIGVETSKGETTVEAKHSETGEIRFFRYEP